MSPPRTRQTCDAIVKTLAKHYPHMPAPVVKTERIISRYFTEREKRDPSIHRSTAFFRPNIARDYVTFQEGVESHVHKIFADCYQRFKPHDPSKQNNVCVWHITHSLVLKAAAKVIGRNTRKRIPFMGWFRTVPHQSYARADVSELRKRKVLADATVMPRKMLKRSDRSRR